MGRLMSNSGGPTAGRYVSGDLLDNLFTLVGKPGLAL